MNIGDKFKHKHDSERYQVEIIDFTNKGYKVKQTETIGKKKPKVTTKFYDKVDFDSDKGLWIPMNESTTLRGMILNEIRKQSK